MPFVLGDNGITFEKVDDLKVDDATYPGYKITYGQDIGDSPKDNYFLYYNETSKKKSIMVAFGGGVCYKTVPVSSVGSDKRKG